MYVDLTAAYCFVQDILQACFPVATILFILSGLVEQPHFDKHPYSFTINTDSKLRVKLL